MSRNELFKSLIEESYPADFLEQMSDTINKYIDSHFEEEFWQSFFEKRERKSLRFNSYKILREYLCKNEQLDRLEKLSFEEYKRLSDKAVRNFAATFFKKYKVTEVSEVSWSSYAYYFPRELSLSRTLEYLAGYFYIQEASAMLPAEILSEYIFSSSVLDLCAAPGGKSLRLSEAVGYSGKLLSNDYSRSRAKVLRFNLRQLGINNATVVSADPKDMLSSMRESFDAIILDAPCSGEGMMRRNRESRIARSKYPIAELVELQKDLLNTASILLRQGGYLVYSTCTFNIEENEKQVLNFINAHPEFIVCEIEADKIKRNDHLNRAFAIDGKKELEKAIRIFPNRAEGDGHFAILLRKGRSGEEFARNNNFENFESSIVNSEKQYISKKKNMKGRKKSKINKYDKNIDYFLLLELGRSALRKFIKENISEKIYAIFGDDFIQKLDLVENTLVLRNNYDRNSAPGIHILYSGMSFGEVKMDKKLGAKFTPGHDLVSSLPAGLFLHNIDLSSDAILANKYLSGQTLTYTDLEKIDPDCLRRMDEVNGTCLLITFDGISLGLLKRQDNIFKNLYPIYLQDKLTKGDLSEDYLKENC